MRVGIEHRAKGEVKKLGRKKGLWVKVGWHRGEVERDNQSVLEPQNHSCTHRHTHTHVSTSSYPCWALFAADCALSPVTFIISHSLIFQPLTMPLLTLSSPCSTTHTHTLSPHHEQSPHASSPSLHQSAGSVPVIPLPSVHQAPV